MPILSPVTLNEYYEAYKDEEVHFSKAISEATGLLSNKMKIRISDIELPCVLYACSLEHAMIIMELSDENFQTIQNAGNLATLYFSFKNSDKNPLNFFISCHIKRFNSFRVTTNSAFMVKMEFCKRPPDDLIQILGLILENFAKFNKRKELRIRMDDRIAAAIGITTVKGYTIVDEIKKPCIFTDVSASGCGIIMNDSSELDARKTITILISTADKTLELKGVILRCEKVNNRPDLIQLGILYDKEEIPYSYKTMINKYIDTLEKLAKHAPSAQV